ncbi:MAG: 50S ribosomal protein L11 [Actinobacteria bacterium]|nr:50S ribosomal protein L11 [Actinomycetota bacterium]|tara:strand:- start:150 stop:575 length:426 start_codon:yes stop_codon:yes gene_type:complete
MAKEVKSIIKLQIPAGKATPAPPIGPALGQHGVNIMDFCKAYNAETKDKGDTIIPVEIYVYKDRSFSFVLKTPPVSVLILKAIGKKSGSPTPNTVSVGTLKRDKLDEIVKIKLPDLNAYTIEQGRKIIEGSAKSMGVKVVS